MRLDFRDDDLRRLCQDFDFALPRLGRDVATALRAKVDRLGIVESEVELRDHKGLHFEKLRGRRAGQHSIRLNKQWRLILRREKDALGHYLVIVEVTNHYDS